MAWVLAGVPSYCKPLQFTRRPLAGRRIFKQGRRPCQPTGLRVSQPESAKRKVRVSQHEGASQPTGGASQPTGRRESANQKARVSQPGWRESANQGGASQPTRMARVRQPGRESDNQGGRGWETFVIFCLTHVGTLMNDCVIIFWGGEGGRVGGRKVT